MDITVWLILQPANHPLPPAKAARRYKVGDVIDVNLATRHAVNNGGQYEMQSQKGQPKFGFLHITGVPEIVELWNLKNSLMSGIGGDQNEFGATPVLRRRQWRFIGALPPSRELTLPWPAFKALFRKKIIVDDLDPNQDDELTTFTDLDMDSI